MLLDSVSLGGGLFLSFIISQWMTVIYFSIPEVLPITYN